MGLSAIKHNTCNCNTQLIQVNSRVRRYDPTRTTVLRNVFVRDVNKRFRDLRGRIRHAIVDQDCFGLRDPVPGEVRITAMAASGVGRRAFAFPRSQDKVDAFMEWLRGQEQQNLLQTTRLGQVGRGIEDAWTNKYIADSYQRGVQRARYELGKAGYDVQSIAQSGGIQVVMGMPMHLDRVGVLYSRTFNDLRGITDTMDQQISRVLSQGMIDGDGPAALARKLTRTISGPVGALGLTDTLGRFIPAERRAQMLARTEIIRAHHLGTIQEYRTWAAVGVKVKAEWATAGYNVCDDCLALEGRVFTIDEIENMIPYHPNCRCVALPLDVTDGGDVGEEGTFDVGGVESVETAPIPAGGAPEARTLMGSAQPMAACVRPLKILESITSHSRPTACTDFYKVGDDWFIQGRPATPEDLERIRKMAIPPGWRNVVVAADPRAKIQAIGMDAAERWQYRFSAEHRAISDNKKFIRARAMARDIDGMRNLVAADLNTGDPRAFLFRLEDKTMIRAGSTTDFKAKVKAYGLTTLQHEHVVVRGSTITFDFIAKEGIRQRYVLTDPVLAPFIAERKAATIVGQQLFPDVSAKKLNTYIKKVAGGKSYTIKDFRTFHGTRIAHEELKKRFTGQTLTIQEKKNIVQEVCEVVSQALRNTPVVARDSYIDPMVWEIIGGLPK